MSMYHNNYNRNNNNDTNSFGSSVDTPDPEIPEDMTEEKAMEIWLRKDDEIRARMIREEEMAAERAAAEPNQEAVLDEQLYHQQQQPNNNNNESNNNTDKCQGEGGVIEHAYACSFGIKVF